jgi:hypothetical protein
MDTHKAHEIPAGLKSVRRRFESWRKLRPTRARIPDSLWAAAVAAADKYGVSRTSRILRLQYYTLKDRVAQRSAAAHAPAEETARGAFVEVAPSVVQGFSTAAAFVSQCECTVELENVDGAKMRVQFKGAQTPDLAALSRSFWNPAP